MHHHVFCNRIKSSQNDFRAYDQDILTRLMLTFKCPFIFASGFSYSNLTFLIPELIKDRYMKGI